MTLSGFTYVVMNQTELDYLDIGDLDENIILLDGMESAIIGLVQSFEGLRVLYDTNKILTLLQNDGMTEDEATDYFSFNIIGGHFGTLNPIFTSYILEPIKTNNHWKFLLR
jgi:hypothetical protein